MMTNSQLPPAKDSAPSMAARLVAIPVHAYRLFLSPLLGPNCRYYPTCSAYALQALQLHGAVRGSWLAARRVCRCHPWHPGGYDPVPLPQGAPSQPRIPDAISHE